MYLTGRSITDQSYVIVFRNVIQSAQIRQHLPLRFQVPASIRGIEIAFGFEPDQVDGLDNLLTQTEFDPQGACGEGNRMPPHQTIGRKPPIPDGENDQSHVAKTAKTITGIYQQDQQSQ